MLKAYLMSDLRQVIKLTIVYRIRKRIYLAFVRIPMNADRHRGLRHPLIISDKIL